MFTCQKMGPIFGNYFSIDWQAQSMAVICPLIPRGFEALLHSESHSQILFQEPYI